MILVFSLDKKDAVRKVPACVLSVLRVLWQIPRWNTLWRHLSNYRKNIPDKTDRIYHRKKIPGKAIECWDCFPNPALQLTAGVRIPSSRKFDESRFKVFYKVFFNVFYKVVYKVFYKVVFKVFYKVVLKVFFNVFYKVVYKVVYKVFHKVVYKVLYKVWNLEW